MSCDSNLFLKNGINILELVKYIEQKYGEYGEVSYDEDRKMQYFNIFFNNNNDTRRMFGYIHRSEDDSERPIPIIPNISCTLMLGLWENSVEILQDIAKHFGGGYVRDNDCGSDGSEEWYFVDSMETEKSIITIQENEIFQFVQNTLDKEKMDLNRIQLTKFLINHINEIKKL